MQSEVDSVSGQTLFEGTKQEGLRRGSIHVDEADDLYGDVETAEREWYLALNNRVRID